MLQKTVFDFATNTTKIVNYERACVIFEPTGLCTNIIDIDEGTTYTPPNEYTYVIDYNAQIGWTWDGASWTKPTDLLNNAYLEGIPSTDTPDLSDESLRIPNTFWVKEKIKDFLNNEFLPTLILDGGLFTDAATGLTYDAGFFDDTGSNLLNDLHAMLFDDTGGTLTSDVHADTF